MGETKVVFVKTALIMVDGTRVEVGTKLELPYENPASIRTLNSWLRQSIVSLEPPPGGMASTRATKKTSAKKR